MNYLIRRKIICTVNYLKQHNDLTSTCNEINHSYLKYSAASGLGSGAGRGGGSGGSIREAGGLLGEIGAAREETYFRKKSSELIDKIKNKKLNEIKYHETQVKVHEETHENITYHKEQIKRHEDAIKRAKQEVEEINSTEK